MYMKRAKDGKILVTMNGWQRTDSYNNSADMNRLDTRT